MKKLTGLIVTVSLFAVACGPTASVESAPAMSTAEIEALQRTDAAIWYANSAERYFTYKKLFNESKRKLDENAGKSSGKPVVLISVENVLTDESRAYMEALSKGRVPTAEDLSNWYNSGRIYLNPGAADFILYCRSMNADMFFITERSSGQVRRLAEFLQLQGLGYFEPESFIIASGTKSAQNQRVQELLATGFVALTLVDDLASIYPDFVEGNASRARVDLLFDEMLQQVVLFPNPMEGSYLRANAPGEQKINTAQQPD